MFIDSFNLTATLAATSCPRCAHEGFVQIDGDAYRAHRKRDRQEPKAIIWPSLYCRCPACGLVAEWPDVETPRGMR